MMRKRSLSAMAMLGAAAALGLASTAVAQVGGGSNFGLFVYPSHGCGARPVPPYRPPELRSYTETQDYSIRIEQHNAELNHFSSCINAYVERTHLDSLRIRDRAEEAIRTAR